MAENYHPCHGVPHDPTSPTGVTGCDPQRYDADPRPKDGPVRRSPTQGWSSAPPSNHEASFKQDFLREPDFYG